MINRVAALFVDSRGVYSKIPGVSVYDVSKDARKYSESLPVVAHPPCQLWINLTHLNYSRWGGDHNKPGNDGKCFEYAIYYVRKNGGILEHPKGSKAFDRFGITKPKGTFWERVSEREYVCEVYQSAYGHKAQKRTWLYYVGNKHPIEPSKLKPKGTHQCGKFDRIKPTIYGKEASATPILFAYYLICNALLSRF